MHIKCFIQARMDSQRFPGKVLAPLCGVPLIRRVLNQVSFAISLDDIVVLTGNSEANAPLISYLKEEEVHCYWSPTLKDSDVFSRFYNALLAYSCDWVMRISGDSPLISPKVIGAVTHYSVRGDLDVVTNVWPFRTFPHGQSVEMIRASAFKRAGMLIKPKEREHVTPVFYSNHDQFAILPIENAASAFDITGDNVAVDTVKYLQRIEKLMKEGKI